MKINISVFDFLGAILPAIPILLIIFLLKGHFAFSSEIFNQVFENLTFEKSALLILASYYIGFILQYPSYELFKRIAPLWGKKRTLGLPISIGKRGKEISKIRELSPNNAKTLETFLAMRIMSYNSFFSLLLFAIVDLIMITQTKSIYRTEEYLFLVFILIICFFSLRRAISFHEWSQNLISDSYSLIKDKPI